MVLIILEIDIKHNQSRMVRSLRALIIVSGSLSDLKFLEKLEDIMQAQQTISHATDSSTLADILERILDKGIVIAGDIKIKLVDIELLTIQIRLLIASVEKAKEMGMDWWVTNPDLVSRKDSEEIESLKERIRELEIYSKKEGIKIESKKSKKKV